MIRFECIVIMMWLPGPGCLETREQWYIVTSNVAVDRSTCAENRFIADKISRNLCVYSCTKMEQCTGVAVENINQSQWCCFFTENLIGVKSGSNVLIHKPEVQTGCVFGFDPQTNCAQCLPSQRYDVELTYLSNGQSRSDVFIDIILGGDLCTQIRGNVDNINIVSGEINRGNRTWTFEAENGTKFRATLMNGNMVNGTGNQPTMGDFIFTATATV